MYHFVNNHAMIIDLAIIVLLCVYSFVGFKKGLLASVLSIISFVLSVYLAYLLLPMVSEWVMNVLKIEPNGQNLISDSQNLVSFLGSGRLANILKSILGIDIKLGTVSEFIVKLVCFLALSTILRLIFKSVFKHLCLILQKTMIFGSVDRMTGLCFGFVKGAVIVGIVSMIIVAIASFESFNLVLGSQISSSALLKVFADGAGGTIETIAHAIFA